MASDTPSHPISLTSATSTPRPPVSVPWSTPSPDRGLSHDQQFNQADLAEPSHAHHRHTASDQSPSGRANKRRRLSLNEPLVRPENKIALSATSQAATQNVAPFLAKHTPHTYNPQSGAPSLASKMSTKPSYCNRHKPDQKCWRQANEPTMEELQNVCCYMAVTLV
jgi:hypothetical protein